ncbi:MAG: hypothetical protein ACTSSH_11350 [Candidatus Heimdallarchaeota archaeon]
MPFTPFHLGFGVLLIAICPFFDPIALLLGTILIDLEPIFHLLFNIGQLHGVFHSVLGVIVLFFPISVISWVSYKLVNKWFNYQYKFRWSLSLISSFLGLFSHILFDAGLYPEMMLFYPFTKQTGFLFGYWDSRISMIALSVMFALGVIILAIKMTVKHYLKIKQVTLIERNEVEDNSIITLKNEN